MHAEHEAEIFFLEVLNNHLVILNIKIINIFLNYTHSLCVYLTLFEKRFNS